METTIFAFASLAAAVTAVKVAVAREQAALERARLGAKPEEGDPAYVSVRSTD